ncbi:MAG TPA: LamG domain-containing protein, partial [Flavipsychrobacter sp.]|nr:LamG domain-containing protein [Flavipsychrobacter sp.]
MKRIIFTVFTLSISIAVLGQIPTNGLVAYYPFNINANDSTTNANNATTFGTPSYQSGVTGNSIHLVGGGYVGIGGNCLTLPPIISDTMHAFSISMWVKEDSLSHSDGEAYIFFGNHSGGYTEVFHDGLNDSVYFSVSGGGGRFGTKFLPCFKGNFVHYALTYSSGIMYVYVNGQLRGVKNQTTSFTNNTAGIGIHWWLNVWGGVSTRFIGSIDEVRIYNRPLSWTEVSQLYSASATNVNCNISCVS